MIVQWMPVRRALHHKPLYYLVFGTRSMHGIYEMADAAALAGQAWRDAEAHTHDDPDALFGEEPVTTLEQLAGLKGINGPELSVTAGNASGIAATAKLTAVRNIRTSGSPRATPTANTMPQIPSAARARYRPNCANRFCSGVFTSTRSSNNSAMRPNSVCIPVATTIPRPRPYVTSVPLNAMLLRSPSDSASRDDVLFSVGTLSPVSADSLIRN